MAKSYGNMSKRERLIVDSLFRYNQNWGNYKSDKWKSKRTLKSQIAELLSLGNFSKRDLINIKEFAESKVHANSWRIWPCSPEKEKE